MTPKVRIEWTHPRFGQISEVACDYHERTVRASLRTLGIGCGGSPYSGFDNCKRCEMTDVRPSAWLASCSTGVDR